MTPGAKVVVGLGLAGGAWYLLTREGTLQGSGFALDELGLVPHEPTPAERARALALRQPGPGNIPITSSPGFIGSGGLVAVGGIGAAVLPLFLSSSLAIGLATAGIGLAVVFLSYVLMKQRASMHTNDVRDQWQKQFVELHSAMGMAPIKGGTTVAPGTLEMAEVIFAIDHDEKQSYWMAVQHTQDERQFRAAATNIDRFLTSNGIPVQDVA